MKGTAEVALDFYVTFLGCRKGAQHDQKIDTAARGRLLKILRAVSWVESAHGTSGENQPERDPIQCGNPKDAWWKELTGQSGKGSRFIHGPNLSNLWANKFVGEAEAFNGFPDAAKMSGLGSKKKGHTDGKFSQNHSYYWGVGYLIHRINTTAGDKSYQCGDLSRDRLIDGAVECNGGGVKDYKERLNKALKLIGDLSSFEALDRIALLEHQGLSIDIARQLAELSTGRSLSHVRLEWDSNGILRAAGVRFD